MKFCVVYVRVSTDLQVENTSLDSQLERCTAYAESEGLKIVKVFREEGQSAKTADRVQLLAALQYICEHKAKYFIVYKVDRLSRNTEDQAVIMQALRTAGAELRSATESIDSTPSGKLMRNILWSFAEFDNSVRAERSIAGSIARFKEGYWPHKPPTGYIMVRDPLTKRSMAMIVPDQASNVEFAFEQRAKGWTLERIAEGMNKRGYRSRKGYKIGVQGVTKILAHPFYMGLMVSYGLEQEGKHTPIVSKDLWYRVQAINERKANQMPSRQIINPLFPLRGLVYCSHCGERLTASAPTGRSKSYAYYHHGSKFCPKAKSIPKAELENQFKEELAKLKPKPSMFKLVKAVILDRWQERFKEHTKDQQKITRQISGVRQEKDNLLTEKRRNPNLYSDEDFITQMQAINGKLRALEVMQSEERTVEDDFEKVLTLAFESLKDPVTSWEQLAIDKKVRFQQILYPEGLKYDGNSYGTAQVSLLMQLFSVASAKREDRIKEVSQYVTRRGIEPLFER